MFELKGRKISPQTMLDLLGCAVALNDASEGLSLEKSMEVIFFLLVVLCGKSRPGVPPSCYSAVESVENGATPRAGMAHLQGRPCLVA